MTTYRVSCGHEGCQWSTQVEIDGDVGPWQPPQVSNVLDVDGEPIVVPWAGQPISDAYAQHHEQVHAPMGQPPMCEWSVA